MVSKLTLSMNPEVVSSAKRYASRHGVSVSSMVETYLAAVSRPSVTSAGPPVLRALRGTLKKADVEDYRKHLSSKYR